MLKKFYLAAHATCYGRQVNLCSTPMVPDPLEYFLPRVTWAACTLIRSEEGAKLWHLFALHYVEQLLLPSILIQLRIDNVMPNLERHLDSSLHLPAVLLRTRCWHLLPHDPRG